MGIVGEGRRGEGNKERGQRKMYTAIRTIKKTFYKIKFSPLGFEGFYLRSV